MNDSLEFLEPAERELQNEFLTNGFVIRPVENSAALEELRDSVVGAVSVFLGAQSTDKDDFLNHIHQAVSADKLNELRLDVLEKINSSKAIRPQYYSMARSLLSSLVGNELAMQNRLNLSIQLPQDEGSLLPIHADVWSGDSPYEAVVWLPLVDCYRSKSMFLLPPAATQSLHQNFSHYSEKSSEDLFRDFKEELRWIEIKYGSVLVFNQNLPHGNRVNQESETRWSLNCRFKSLFSPYGDKKLGEFFSPITLRPASKIGMEYSFPKT